MNSNLLSCVTQFEKRKCCLLIYSYNNAPVLRDFLLSLTDFFPFLIVVNDGSTNETSDILSAHDHNFTQIHLNQRSGKGIALKTGLDKAKELGYDFVLTLDANGQYLISDLPLFFEMLENHPGSLLIGDRKIRQEKVQRTISTSDRISNFLFYVMTGKKLPDTQCSYRLYPIYKLENLQFLSVKYKFEMEILVRGVWRGVEVVPVPINVNAPPKDKQITYFQKSINYTRALILNIILMLLGLIWYRPYNLFRRLRELNPRQVWNDYVLGSGESNLRLSLAVMLGLFIGVSPLWGYQIVTILLLCHILKLNKVVALITGNISIPPMIPLIIWGSYKIGGFFVEATPIKNISIETEGTFAMIKENLFQYIIGSLTLGLILAVFGGIVSYILLKYFRK